MKKSRIGKNGRSDYHNSAKVAFMSNVRVTSGLKREADSGHLTFLGGLLQAMRGKALKKKKESI